MNIRELSNRLDSLVIFRAVLDDAVLARLRTALGALERGEGAVGALADFEAALFAHTCDWTEYLMETVLEVMRLLKILGEKGSRIAVSDVGVGVLFAQAALEGASLNVFINTKLMKDRGRAEKLNQKTESMIAEGREWKEIIYRDVLGHIQ